MIKSTSPSVACLYISTAGSPVAVKSDSVRNHIVVVSQESYHNSLSSLQCGPGACRTLLPARRPWLRRCRKSLLAQFKRQRLPEHSPRMFLGLTLLFYPHPAVRRQRPANAPGRRTIIYTPSPIGRGAAARQSSRHAPRHQQRTSTSPPPHAPPDSRGSGNSAVRGSRAARGHEGQRPSHQRRRPLLAEYRSVRAPLAGRATGIPYRKSVRRS